MQEVKSWTLTKTTLGYSVNFKCPNCSDRLVASVKECGKTERCPNCLGEYLLPDGPRQQLEAAIARATEERKKAEQERLYVPEPPPTPPPPPPPVRADPPTATNLIQTPKDDQLERIDRRLQRIEVFLEESVRMSWRISLYCFLSALPMIFSILCFLFWVLVFGQAATWAILDELLRSIRALWD